MSKVLEILTYPDPILTTPAVDVEFMTEGVSELIEDMFLTMEENRGIGLAANQVGKLLRILVMKVSQPMVMINPRVVKYSHQTSSAWEGCLSFPGIQVQRERNKQVKVEFLDEDWNPRVLKLRGLEARCFQHELDHLDGQLMRSEITPEEYVRKV